MKSNPVVSVIMPAYNAERFIEQAINSVLAQTFEDWELIVVDDCSTDATASIVEGYTKRDSRISTARLETNGGVAQARNYGYRLAKGAYIALLDADDAWERSKLEKQLATLSSHTECSICFTGSAFMGLQGELFDYVLSVPDQVTYEELLCQNVISCSSVLVCREALGRFPMPSDELLHEDYVTWLSILKEEPYALGINEPLLIYRVNQGSKSGNKLLAAKMQFRAYRYIGLDGTVAFVSFLRYAIRGMRKWTAILRSRNAGSIQSGQQTVLSSTKH